MHDLKWLESLYESAHYRFLTMIRKNCVQEGHFDLRSGARSNVFIDLKKVTMCPEGAHLVGKLIRQKLNGADIVAVGGPATGAIPLVCSTVLHSRRWGHGWKGFWLPKNEPTIHGCKLNKGDRVAILEDVLTTGWSVLRTIERMKEIGCEVVKIVAVVDRTRNDGGDRVVWDRPYECIYTLDEILLMNGI